MWAKTKNQRKKIQSERENALQLQSEQFIFYVDEHALHKLPFLENW